jgi:hypothetical protein
LLKIIRPGFNTHFFSRFHRHSPKPKSDSAGTRLADTDAGPFAATDSQD